MGASSVINFSGAGFISSIALFLLLLPAGLSPVQAQEDSASVYGGFWEEIAKDTFPFLRSHEATAKVADASMVLALLAKEQIPAGYAGQMLQAYYYNLLAARMAVVDSLERYLMIEEPTIYKDLLGHIALKSYVPCFGDTSAICDSIRLSIRPWLRAAAMDSEVMPPEQWQWMLNQLGGRSRFTQSDLELSLAHDGLPQTGTASLEGGVLKFSRTPGKQNLLISQGPRRPLQVLELNDSGQWTDVSEEAGLDTFPGGHLLYNIDFNNDALDDLMVLRKASTRKSPAKYHLLLFKNKGDGKFDEVSAAADLRFTRRPNCACWHDINRDGLHDVFIGNEYTPSYWMVQQPDGRFRNMAWSYGTIIGNKNVVDCAIADFNNDGLDDLYLSLYGDSNMVYLQKQLNDSFFFFYNKSAELELREPFVSGQMILTDYLLDNEPEVFIQADFSGRYDIIAAIMNRRDTIDFEPSVLAGIRGDRSFVSLAEPDLGLYRAGVMIEHASGVELLAGGGKNTESLYPLFHYTIDQNGHQSKIKMPDLWPAYVHSATVYADSSDQPVVVFKGGGSYPLMSSREVSYRIQMPGAGRFVRLFKYDEVSVGTKITFNYLQPGSEPLPLVRTVRPLDSKGYYALQEWLWLPEGHEISDIKFPVKQAALNRGAENLLPFPPPVPDAKKKGKGRK